MKTIPAGVLSICAVTLCGCIQNPYSQYFVDLLRGKPLSGYPMLIGHAGEPRLYSTTDQKRDARALAENGFVMIGDSSFNEFIKGITHPFVALILLGMVSLVGLGLFLQNLYRKRGHRDSEYPPRRVIITPPPADGCSEESSDTKHGAN